MKDRFKHKKQIFIIITGGGLCLALLLAGGCVPEEPNPTNTEYKTRLWRICHFDKIQDTIPFCFDYFQYDSLNRITKSWSCLFEISDTTASSSFSIYYYNSKNQLINKYNYLDLGIANSVNYEYLNNLLIKEEINFPNPSDPPHIFTYEYENNLLIKKIYSEDTFKYYIHYEYLDSLCVKETQFHDQEGTIISSYTLNYYINGLVIRSEFYDGPTNMLGYIINYTYNESGQLVLEEAIGNPEWQAPSQYIYRYEYEKVPY